MVGGGNLRNGRQRLLGHVGNDSIGLSRSSVVGGDTRREDLVGKEKEIGGREGGEGEERDDERRSAGRVLVSDRYVCS